MTAKNTTHCPMALSGEVDLLQSYSKAHDVVAELVVPDSYVSLRTVLRTDSSCHEIGPIDFQ
jgi:hypothetical protein